MSIGICVVFFSYCLFLCDRFSLYYPKSASNFRSSCLKFLKVGVTSVSLHPAPLFVWWYQCFECHSIASSRHSKNMVGQCCLILSATMATCDLCDHGFALLLPVKSSFGWFTIGWAELPFNQTLFPDPGAWMLYHFSLSLFFWFYFLSSIVKCAWNSLLLSCTQSGAVSHLVHRLCCWRLS